MKNGYALNCHSIQYAYQTSTQ